MVSLRINSRQQAGGKRSASARAVLAMLINGKKNNKEQTETYLIVFLKSSSHIICVHGRV
jgi:hypothetical protein